MRKAPEAFRTISEAAEALDTPAHVLRFWESKFSQVKPVKRAGGRRYYRPADIDLLAGIKTLLHEQGMTIRGVQKLLQEKGARHVAALAPSAGEMLEGSTAPVLKLVPSEADAQVVPAATPAEASNDMVEEASATEGAAESETSAMAAPETATVSETKPADDPADGTDEDQAASDDAAQDTEDDVKMAADDADAELPQADTRPAPALAALLDAAADGQPKPPLRFAMIAHALRTNPPKTPNIRAETLARLVALVEKISARAD